MIIALFLAPLLCILMSVLFGELLALAENWHFWESWQYVASNMTSQPNAFNNKTPNNHIGIALSAVIDLLALVGTTVVTGLLTMNTFVNSLPTRLNLHRPFRGIIFLFVLIPLALVLICVASGAMIAFAEEKKGVTWKGVLTWVGYVFSLVCGLTNPLTSATPTTFLGISLTVVLGMLDNGILGLILGLVTNIDFIVNFVREYEVAFGTANDDFKDWV